MVPGEVFRIVLPLAVWVIRRLAKYTHSVPASLLIVSVDVFDANHDPHFCGDLAIHFNQDHGAIPHVQLSSMIAHTDAQGEPECLA